MSYDSPFEEVQRDPDVCNNCFRRRYHRYARNFAVDTFKGDIWIRETEDLPDQRTPVRKSNARMPHDRMTKGTCNTCACGYQFGDKMRPLPKSLFLEYANNLAERYSEDGVSFDSSEFFDALNTMKSDPAEQFADDRMYRQATSRAVQLENIRSSAGRASGD